MHELHPGTGHPDFEREHVDPSQLHTKSNASFRLNRAFSKVVPFCLFAFILKGWHYMLTSIAPTLPSHHSSLYIKAYLTTFNLLMATLLSLFLLTHFAPVDHSSPSAAPVPLSVSQRTKPFECHDDQGGLARCYQDRCNGAILPPRARHCKDCKRCRLDFDHCCPWIACIARDTLKPFLLFLALVPPTMGLGLWEAIPIARLQFTVVKACMWESDVLDRLWWRRWFSWLGGPLFRLGGAVVMAYWHIPGSIDASTYPSGLPYPPSLTPVIYAVVGTILAVLTLFLLVHSIHNVLLGIGTIDIERARLRKRLGVSTAQTSLRVFLPNSQIPSGGPEERSAVQVGKVIEVPSGSKLYDDGPMQNWRDVMGTTFLDWLSECRTHSGNTLPSLSITAERIDSPS